MLLAISEWAVCKRKIWDSSIHNMQISYFGFMFCALGQASINGSSLNMQISYFGFMFCALGQASINGSSLMPSGIHLLTN
jgi:hypothetical protein